MTSPLTSAEKQKKRFSVKKKIALSLGLTSWSVLETKIMRFDEKKLKKLKDLVD